MIICLLRRKDNNKYVDFLLDELRMMWFKAYAIKWLLPLFPGQKNKQNYFIAKHSQTNDLLCVYRLIYLEGMVKRV